MKISERIRQAGRQRRQGDFVHRFPNKPHRTMAAKQANLTFYPDGSKPPFMTLYGIKPETDEDKKDLASMVAALKGKKIVKAELKGTMLDLWFK